MTNNEKDHDDCETQKKLVAGKNLTETGFTVLLYLVANIDRANRSGCARRGESELHVGTTVMRLSTKMGYRGFVEMLLKLMTMFAPWRGRHAQPVDAADDPLQSAVLDQNDATTIRAVAQQIAAVENQYLYLYAAGFSGVIGHYMFKISDSR